MKLPLFFYPRRPQNISLKPQQWKPKLSRVGIKDRPQVPAPRFYFGPEREIFFQIYIFRTKNEPELCKNRGKNGEPHLILNEQYFIFSSEHIIYI